MFINKSEYRLQDENDGDGNDLGGSYESEDNVAGEAPADESASEYLFGDVTSEEAVDQFGYIRDLPEHLRGLESRVSDTINPVMEQLTALQEKMGSQPAFDPKLEKFGNALRDYDPKLAEAVLPALIEDLKSSLAMTPLGPEMLAPHVGPMLEQTQQRVIDQLLPSMLDSLVFDANGIVNRDPQNPDSVLAPQTELQKDFAKWWEHTDAPTRKALGSLGVPYYQALQKFGKWRAGHMRSKGEAAGAASARLSGAAQDSRGGQREAASRKLETEADGFNSVFKSRS